MIVEFAIEADGRNILVNLRPASFSLTIDVSTIYTFDATGRLMGAYAHGRNYLRGLSNRILVKWGAGHGLAKRSRIDLDEAGKRAFIGDMLECINGIADAVRRRAVSSPGRRLDDGALDTVVSALSTVMDYEALAADGRRFETIYRPISILPPDQYLALVLQATEGCSWNKCTFCDFYRDRPFRIKRAADFRRHVRDVVAFLGPALALRRSVFLADANALVIEQRRLMELLDIVNAELPMEQPAPGVTEERRSVPAQAPALRGIFSFVDAFTGRRKSEDDYRQMARAGLRRVYIGLESGDDDVLQFLHKGSSAQDAVSTVRAIKAAGVDVGVIVMLGVGGKRFAVQHVRGTIAAVNAMGLGERDILYFSPFVQGAGFEYGRIATEMGVQPIDAAAMDLQMSHIRTGLQWRSGSAPKVAVYDIREFIY